MTDLDDEALTDEELLAGIRAIEDARAEAAGAIPDPEYVARQRAMFVGLCELYAAANYAASEIGDFDGSGNGGLLLRQAPTVWRPGPCGSSRALNAIADAAYELGADE